MRQSWHCRKGGRVSHPCQYFFNWSVLNVNTLHTAVMSGKNRIMTERPNICYIFEKLSVQGCQIWHSHVSMPFNSAPANSTRPHNAKKLFTSSFQVIFLKIRFTKLLHNGHFYMMQQIFSFHCRQVQGAYLGQILLHTATSNTPKMLKNGRFQ